MFVHIVIMYNIYYKKIYWLGSVVVLIKNLINPKSRLNIKYSYNKNINLGLDEVRLLAI